LLVGAPTPQPWAASHAALPTVDEEGDDGFALYYSARDARNRAHIARARVDADGDDLRVASHEPEPVLSPGPLGAFDDCGVTISCLVQDGDRKLLYYTGWTRARTVPFHFYIGLAVSDDGGHSFERVSPAPILGRRATDPYLTASPWVLREGDAWRMWYVSCVGWEDDGAAVRHRYHVRRAESDDAMAWQTDGRPAVDFADPREYAMGRPCVARENGAYRMWFCARGDKYRLAYAESDDGRTWERRDGALRLDGEAADWETDMQAYPVLARAGGRRHLLYNGNGYGRSGIGYATGDAA